MQFTGTDLVAAGAVGVVLGVIGTYYALVFAEWRDRRDRLPAHWKAGKR